MASVWLTLHAGLRGRWRKLTGLALLLGLVGGCVLAAAAGARRTDTAYPRLLRWASASQVDVITGAYAPALYQRMGHLPQVASVSVAGYYQTFLPVRHGFPRAQIATYSSLDGSLGLTTDRVKVLSGRLFDPTDPRAVMIDQRVAAMLHLRPGGTLRLLVVPSDPVTGNPDPQRAVPRAFRVSAVVLFDNQIVPANLAGSQPTVLVTPPFSHTALARSASFGYQAAVRLRPGASRPAFARAVTALAADIPAAHSDGLYLVDEADQVSAATRAISTQAIALAAFAALAGLITLAVIGQLLTRQLLLDSAEFPTLRALGMTRARLVTLSLARLACLTATGGVLAVLTAVAASPLTPIGRGRLAEPHPGVEVNLAVLAAGFGAIALLPLMLVGPWAWRVAGRPGGPLGIAEPTDVPRSRLATALGVAGSMTGGIGVRMAFEPGHGRTAVPVRSALLGTAIAVAAVVTASVFGASFDRLLTTPRLYGQNWQAELNLQFGAVTPALGTRLMAMQPDLSGYAAGNYGRLSVDGQQVSGIGLDAVEGGHFLTVLAGRAPRRPGEIALGTQTLRDIHGRLGQLVSVRANGRQARPMRVVGVVVLPAFGAGTVVTTGLGSGAVVPARVLSVPFPQTDCTGRDTCYNFFLVRYRPGISPRAASARLHATVVKLGCPPGSCSVISDQRPSDIRNYGGIRDTPLALGVVLALLAAGTLAHVLLTGLRRRQRDLAMLKTLGLLRRQLLQVTAWQVSALAAAALLAGLPAGVMAGRWAWTLFADSAGVPPAPDVPVALVLAIIPATLLLANLVAAGPGWAAGRIHPAPVLRSE